jgi:DnaJ-class molecular chaperone
MDVKKEKDICSIYEAAYLTKLSPELLVWLTKYSPKYGLPDKLKYNKKQENIYFFERQEVLSFNDWLKKPWPKPENASRPAIPTAILREIQNEANLACAMCHGYHGTCEAAHIDPVSKSFNNHPDNLIWLCSNHHTAYDKGLYRPREQDREFIVGFKKSLQHFKALMWSTQNKISANLLMVLEDCTKLHEQLKPDSTPEQIQAIEKIAQGTLADLPRLFSALKPDSNHEEYLEIQKEIHEVSNDSQTSITERLEKTKAIKDDYISVYGYVVCPLCDGERRHNGNDCPVCHGEGDLDKRYADNVDLREYSLVTCPLCDGERRHNGNDCPVCHGEGDLDKRYADNVDLREYSLVTCPLCDGERRHNGNDCPVCHGEGNLDKRYADNVDLREYSLVTCPLCDGERRHNGNDCPVCHGEGNLDKRYADNVDLREYDLVTCPLCRGERRYCAEDCPVCHGEGNLDKRYADNVNLDDFRAIDCPYCRGRGQRNGNECRNCDGNGKIEKRYLS